MSSHSSTTNTLSIEEATTRKVELTENITKMLSTFTTATGLSVDSIDIERTYILGPDYAPRYIVAVEVKL